MNTVQTIGIVGGGQLGRMLTMAAKPLGFNVAVVDPTGNCPAAQVGAQEIIADFYNTDALRQLAEIADVITIEFEHLDIQTLEELERLGTPIHPHPNTIRMIQDKLTQKQFLHNAGIPVAPFSDTPDRSSARLSLKKFGGKMLLKTRLGGYDGKGNMLVKNNADIDKAFNTFREAQLYAEAYIPFSSEIAVMVARTPNNAVQNFPIVETIHRDNICHEVLAPAPQPVAILQKARRVALKTTKLLHGAGVYGIEIFVTRNGQVLINEIAPRVHNSGHYTIEATRTSQFEQHIRAITGLPLGDTQLIYPAAAMINILGERDGAVNIDGLAEATAIPHTSIHVYGKSPTKMGRKMGHITATASSLAQARRRAKKARKLISI